MRKAGEARFVDNLKCGKVSDTLEDCEGQLCNTGYFASRFWDIFSVTTRPLSCQS